MKNKLSTGIAFMAIAGFYSGFAQTSQHPNVLLIITDDQGFGDLAINGNPHVHTPVIDNFARQSIRLTNFYVSPVCAPTRSSLMTGRFSLRTGVRDTYNGGAIMAASEVTIAEVLKQANYKTGAFGKWHLGDNYPSRPIDQGFDESLMHLSGGMGQVGDFTTFFKGDSSYFNPVLWHNGKQEKYKGYCSDIFAANAIDFIEKNQNAPFFCYLAFNAPHTPLQVPDEYYQKYKDIDPSAGFGNDKRPFTPMNETVKEDARRVYAMVNNIDDNLSKLFKKLDELKLTQNTIVIFMTDNGPQQTRYNAGMRGLKGSVYRGGVRVPFYLRYPARLEGNKDIETTAAHIDVLPTLADLCGVALPKDRKIDGKNLVPLLKGETSAQAKRKLFFYWTRRYPELYNNIAFQNGDFKLVGHADFNAPLSEFELFDLKKDSYEQTNLIGNHPEIAAKLKISLDSAYKELVSSENLIHPQRAIIGSKMENPVFLNRNDADGEKGIWSQDEIYGFWKVKILAGTYNIRYKFIEPVKANGQMYLETRSFINQMKNTKGDTDMIEMKNVSLPEMECDLIPYYTVGAKKIFPFWVEMERVE